KCFVRSRTMREISLQQSLDRPGRVLGLEVVKNLLSQSGVRPKTATCEQMIAFDGVIAVASRHLCGYQADVADKMLRTRMVAAGEMDVDRRIDLEASLAPVADFRRVALGIRGR